nr:cytochrome c [Propylenella binzhouense]
MAALLVVSAVLGAAAWWLTAPQPLAAGALPPHQADLANGERMFWAGGCASCHAAKGAKGDERLKLGGGLALATPFGTFNVPNISPDPETGIGRWSDLDFASAMMRGVAPGGVHLYPAFPYPSYARMRIEDVLDLRAYLGTLPPVAHRTPPHDLAFPYNVRRGIGLWKRLYLHPGPVIELAGADGEVLRGRYLVEGPGHCGECHTARDVMGGSKLDAWLAGAPNPEGRGTIPNITPHEEGIADWSAKDIAYALESGFKPDFDSFGGSMVEVQENMAKLPAEDRDAIAAYLKAIPPHPDAVAPERASGAESEGGG